MNAFNKSTDKSQSQQDYSENDLKNVRVVRFPREVKIFGSISRVYVEGNERHERLIFDRDQPSVSRENYREKGKHYVIIPIKDRNSEVQFVKAPLYKLNRKPKAKKTEDVKCRKLNPFGEETTTEDLAKWSADKKEIFEWNNFVSSCRADTQTVFTFHQTDVSGRRKSEFQKPTTKASPLAIKSKEDDKKQQQDKDKDSNEQAQEQQDAPPPKKHKSSQSGGRDFPRLLQYLITLKGRRKGKRLPSN